MFNRIALAWIWALVVLIGLKYPPALPGRWLELYRVVLWGMLVVQCVTIVVFTWKEYWRLRDADAALKQQGYELEQDAQAELMDGTYGD